MEKSARTSFFIKHPDNGFTSEGSLISVLDNFLMKRDKVFEKKPMRKEIASSHFIQ